MKLKIHIILIIYGGLALYIATSNKQPGINPRGLALLGSIYGHPDYEAAPTEDSVLEGVHTVLQYNIEKIQIKGQ